VQTSAKDPEGWSAADKFTLVLVTAGLNATELSAYCRALALFPEQVDRWRNAAEDANAQPLLTMDDQKNLQMRNRDWSSRDVNCWLNMFAGLSCKLMHNASAKISELQA